MHVALQSQMEVRPFSSYSVTLLAKLPPFHAVIMLFAIFFTRLLSCFLSLIDDTVPIAYVL